MGSSKLMTLDEAVSTYVNDGDIIGIGGLSFWRKPISGCREIIRQNKKDLTVCTFVGGIDVDMLIAGGCASEVRSCFVGMEIFGMAPHYRKAVESGSIKISEESEATIALGLRASYLKVPFMPLKGIIGTDLLLVLELRLWLSRRLTLMWRFYMYHMQMNLETEISPVLCGWMQIWQKLQRKQLLYAKK